MCRPENAARQRSGNRVVSISQEVGRSNGSMHRSFLAGGGGGGRGVQKAQQRCARTTSTSGVKRPKRAITEGIHQSGLPNRPRVRGLGVTVVSAEFSEIAPTP